MATYSSFATDEPGEAEELLSRAYPRVSVSVPRERSRFRLVDERFDADSFTFDEIEVGARVAFGYQPEGKVYVSWVVRGTQRVRHLGADETLVAGDLGLIGLPGVETALAIEDFRHDVVTLRAAALREAAGLDVEDEGQTPTFTGVRPISAWHALAWRRTIDLLAVTLRGDPAATESPLVLGPAGRLLASLALATFPNSATSPPVRGDDRGARSPATLRRAVAFIETNAEGDIGIEDIAAAARVSRRAVQQAFRRHLDTTPTAYLRRIRLDAAHRELIDAAPGEGLTVTEVAYRWGFSSPSRFTERYRAAFGTTPSATLRS